MRLIPLVLALLLTQTQAQTEPVSSAPGGPALLPAQEASERLRIDRERAALHATWNDEQKACRQGFWVTDCLKDAQTRHRQALAQLQRQQVLLDQALSRQRSQAAHERVQEKQQAQSQRAVVVPAQASASGAAGREAQARERALRQQQRIEAADLREQQREREAGTRSRSGQTGVAPAATP